MSNPVLASLDRHRAGWMLALALLMLSQLVGCASLPTDAQRDASFEPHRDLTVAGQPVAEFIKERTAVLISCDAIEPDDGANSTNGIRYQLPSHQRVLDLSLGLAVAIDGRGYFLTAQHVLEHGKLIVTYHCNGRQQLTRPRVVALLPDLDVAILSVDAPLSATFEWAPPDSFKPGETLLLGGMGEMPFRGEKLPVKRQFLAGVLQGTSPASEGLAVRHTAPNRPGDSGGPTLDMEGRLVGITSRIIVLPFAKPTSIAFRPDAAVISRLIAVDAESHQLKLR